MSTKALYRWAAAAVILSGITMTAGGATHPEVDAASITTARWAVAHVLWWTGTLSGMVGLAGLYLRQREGVGVLGFAGIGLAWMGTAVLSGAMFFEAIVVPTLLATAPELVQAFPRGEGWGVFIAAVLASGVLLGIGFVLFGGTMLRTALLPRWATVCVMIGGIAQGVSFLLPHPVAALGGIAFGAGLVGLGHGLWVHADDAVTIPATTASLASSP